MKTKYIATYDKEFKRFTIGILSIICISYILGASLYYLSYPINYLFLAGSILNALPILLVYKIPVTYIKRIVKIYLTIIIIPLYIITVVCLLKAIITPLFWYIVIPVYLYTVFPSRKTIKWSIAALCLMLSAFILTFAIQYLISDNTLVYFQPMSLLQMLLTEIINAFFALATICYCLYYMHRFHEIQIAQLEYTNSVKNKMNNTYPVPTNVENNKYDNIYAEIIEYIEEKQPYLNPDFKITQMVHDLNTNATYLTRAIKKNTNMNFNSLINYYRIEKVKELLQINTSKYTLEYIYRSAGFKSQSSFNRAFKLHLNITPSEYYKKIEKIEKDSTIDKPQS